MKGRFTLSVDFNCNPELAEDLVVIVEEELAKLATSLDANDLKQIQSGYAKLVDSLEEDAGFWMENIVAAIQYIWLGWLDVGR